MVLSYYEGFANSAEECKFYSKGTTKLLEFFKNRMTCTILAIRWTCQCNFIPILTCHEGVISSCLPETISLNQWSLTPKVVHYPQANTV